MKPSINLPIEDFDYPLPDQLIAYTPTANRSDSKLLVWNKEIIAESTYNHIANFIAEKAALYFNNSKVIAARIHFQKANNATIEIFCLEPSAAFQPISVAMQATQKVEWICLVGGAKKWKEDFLEKEFEITPSNNGKNKAAVNNNTQVTVKVRAKKIKLIEGKFLIEFSWDNDNISFSEIIEHIGSIPLPPYIQRATTEEDKHRYQTTYAKQEGSVAAPTAGLHFDAAIFDALAQKKCSTEFISLHVGAGTFMPVKTDNITDHEMHAEVFEITTATLTHLIDIANQKELNPDKYTPVIAVGTTTLRTIETLYWLGVKLINNPSLQKNKDLQLMQWDAYETNNDTSDQVITVKEAVSTLLNWMQSHQMDQLITSTQLMIVPGYTFKIVNGLVTNFHQPKSTLLLIIAAITGDSWKEIYQHAIENQYRFLSYGDGCYFKIN
ncbi:MAG: S-adenosylmethionine:tRNA ribosyltransferase-isomerase [Sediminibacterium sp.]|nr:MAG: S-adenosylmethionine:tRNA ribosyltransferase-isomerase [Sediminibacterium sp.]